ncbi:MAG: diguanylate cyclase [Desulfobulbaceae bacterium]|nr:diguanylate cyclase [Desulfobulbaceae bacterium]
MTDEGPIKHNASPRRQPLLKLARRFWRLSISQKMHLGFLPLVLLIFIISLFALTKLNQLNRLNASILQVNIPARAALEKMRRTIFDQESFIRRYTILKDQELLKIQQDLNREFIKGLDTLRNYPTELRLPLGALDESYADYTATLLNGIKLIEESPGRGQEFDQQVRLRQTEVINNLAEIGMVVEADQNAKSGISADIGSLAFNAALALCVVGILFSATAATIVTRNIVGAVRKLQFATEMISQGNFDYRADIRNQDELGELSEAFAMMATRLKNLEEMYLDASPLTRLPGGVAIENILKKKIEQHKLFAFCLMDIDNFKSFNDHYGYAKGNELIQSTAALVEKAVATHGNNEDFIGHIGGDDFVVITTPDRCGPICAAVVEEFDTSTPDFYNSEDRNRGFIIGENRQGQEVKFPLASISVAVVSNQTRPLKNHIQVGEIAAEIKEHAKSISGSAIFIDQRQYSLPREKNPKVVNLPERKQA